MNKFRFYSEIPHYIRAYHEDILILGRSIEEEDRYWYGDIEIIDEEYIKNDLLPPQYWREGMYLFSCMKISENKDTKRIGIERKGQFGSSMYIALYFYKGMWFSCTETETERDRLNFPQPSQKEWELMLQIPEKYLNEYYKLYRNYWYWIHETNRMKYDAKLSAYKFTKELD